MTLMITSPFHVELHYYVLSCLDLGRDAANLYEPSRRKEPWIDELLSAYQSASGRLTCQILSLYVEDLPSLFSVLRNGRLVGLQDEPGLRLRERLDSAMMQMLPVLEQRFIDQRRKREKRAKQAEDFLFPRLERLLEVLYGKVPSIDIVQCASLGNRRYTHGRGLIRADRHLVAVSFEPPLEQVLCQIFHEAIHPMTDPPIRTRFGAILQETRVSSPAFALHRELEQRAVQKGDELIAQCLPELHGAYSKWRRRYGI
jgi:hypothetical protein